MTRSGLAERLTLARRTAWNRLFRARAGRQEVCIISNNCWGGFLYQRLGRQYASPFVGLFLMPDCYLTLLERLEFFLRQPIKFVSVSKYNNAEMMRQRQRYPIGSLGGDVELHFLHSNTESDAKSSWERRLTRLNRSHLFIKMCDRDGCTEAHLERFAALNYERKVCFVSRRSDAFQNIVYIGGFESAGALPPNLVDYVDATFDTAHWLRTGLHRQTPFAIRQLHRLLLVPGSAT